MKDPQISKHCLPSELNEPADICEPDAPKIGRLLTGVEYAPSTSL